MPQDVIWSDADFVRFTRATVADLRAAYARYPGDPGIDGLVTELLALSPRFADMWAEHEVEVRAEQVGQPDHLRVPGAEQPRDGVALGRGAPSVQPGMQVRHTYETPVAAEG